MKTQTDRRTTAIPVARVGSWIRPSRPPGIRPIQIVATSGSGNGRAVDTARRLAWAGIWAGAGYVLGEMANGRFATDLTAPATGAVSILMMIAGAYVVVARLRQGLVADAGGTT